MIVFPIECLVHTLWLLCCKTHLVPKPVMTADKLKALEKDLNKNSRKRGGGGAASGGDEGEKQGEKQGQDDDEEPQG